MKNVLFLVSLLFVLGCGNSTSAVHLNADSAKVDTSARMPVLKDTSLKNSMNADTNGMGNAR
ncbi:MAG: hypothetical protein M3040_18470 [Bacteroidota bacterium]|nr:hypothetical protein [Bacteroidota bacterium]